MALAAVSDAVAEAAAEASSPPAAAASDTHGDWLPKNDNTNHLNMEQRLQEASANCAQQHTQPMQQCLPATRLGLRPQNFCAQQPRIPAWQLNAQKLHHRCQQVTSGRPTASPSPMLPNHNLYTDSWTVDCVCANDTSAEQAAVGSR